jgi:hypothetical protein
MAQSTESLTKALRRLQRVARSDDPARLHAVPPAICIDMLLAELRARRKRVKAWICLLNEEINRSRSGGMSRKSRCRIRPAAPGRKAREYR